MTLIDHPELTLPELLGPSESTGAGPGYWRLWHLDQDGRPACGNSIEPNDLDREHPLLLDLPCVHCVTYRRLERAAQELDRRARTVHERVGCPTCHAPAGARCRRLGRGRPELKHSHQARLTADGIPIR